jgi:hypothetical protein
MKQGILEVIPTTFTAKRRPMISASYEAESRVFDLHKGASGKRWLVAHQENAADNIYVEGDKNSDGFAGRLITFTLVEGSEITLKGPWHSNSDAHFHDTGIDLRDKHRTFGAVGKERIYEGDSYMPTLIDVLHQDQEPVIGYFNRIETIAQRLANDLDMQLYYYSESSGGSGCGPIKPKR